MAEDPFWDQYEAVVSALAIHHLNNQGKKGLFQRVCDAVCDGGAFINADQVLGVTPEISEEYKAAWLRQVRERGVSEGDLTAALERMREDEMCTLSLQMKYLEDIGLRTVNCWYKNYGFVVYSGRRASAGWSIPLVCRNG